MCRAFGLTLTASLKSLVLLQNMHSVSLFYIFYFGRCTSQVAELVPQIVLGGQPITVVVWVVFKSLFLDALRTSMPTVFFNWTHVLFLDFFFFPVTLCLVVAV